jgi:hypothetical protein
MTNVGMKFLHEAEISLEILGQMTLAVEVEALSEKLKGLS